jgi:hypothetical protein
MTPRCLVAGRHTPGSQWERECPLRNAAQLSARAKKAAQARQERRRGAVATPGTLTMGNPPSST